jgi:hypothetical protein
MAFALKASANTVALRGTQAFMRQRAKSFDELFPSLSSAPAAAGLSVPYALSLFQSLTIPIYLFFNRARSDSYVAKFQANARCHSGT